MSIISWALMVCRPHVPHVYVPGRSLKEGLLAEEVATEATSLYSQLVTAQEAYGLYLV